MKVVFCFLAITVAYITCETCTSASNCAATTCNGAFILGCVQGMCVCNPNANHGACALPNDCVNLQCGQHQGADDVHCVDEHCLCGHPQNGGPGGPPIGK